LFGEAVQFAALGLGILALAIAITTGRRTGSTQQRDSAVLVRDTAHSVWTMYRHRSWGRGRDESRSTPRWTFPTARPLRLTWVTGFTEGRAQLPARPCWPSVSALTPRVGVITQQTHRSLPASSVQAQLSWRDDPPDPDLAVRRARAGPVRHRGVGLHQRPA